MKKVLVVDDMHDIADTTAIMLRLHGHVVRTAYNGREAVTAVCEERPDVVLLDLNMPVLDGFDAARAIRGLHPTHPPLLIAVSALTRSGLSADLQASGFDHHLTKPANIESLLSLVEDAPD
jgi:CheY-like chemotaxis protein